MAIVFRTPLPEELEPINNSIYVIVSDTNTSTKYNYYYRYDFFLYDSLTGSTPTGSPLTSIKVLPNPYNMEPDYTAGYGEFNIGLIYKDYVNIVKPTYSFTGNSNLLVDTENLKRYRLVVNPVYSDNATEIPTIKTGEADFIEGSFLNAVLYNEQLYNYDVDKYRIKSNYVYNTDDKVNLLTNRPLKSNIAEINQFDVINISSILSDQTYSYYNYEFKQAAVFFRQPASQPFSFDNNWEIMYNNSNMTATFDSLDGDNYTSPILAVYGGYMNTTSDFYQDSYSIYTGTPGEYFGNYLQLRKGSYLRKMKLRFNYFGATPTFTNQIRLLGRRVGTNTWDELLASNTTVLLSGSTYVIRWNNGVTIERDYAELGIRFVGVPSSSITLNKNCFTFNDETDVTEKIEFNTTMRAFYMVGYNNLNQIVWIEQQPLPEKPEAQSFNMMEPRSFMFRKELFDEKGISYAKVFVGPLTNNIDHMINNNKFATEVYTIENNCNKLSSYENKTIVWHNRLGAWDSFDFIAVNQIENKINKVIYTQPRTRLFTKSTLQNKQFNVDFEQEITISTKPINKLTINWLKELLDADVVYEFNKLTNELIPITILTNSIVEKPINNIIGQVKLNYTYSQKEITR